MPNLTQMCSTARLHLQKLVSQKKDWQQSFDTLKERSLACINQLKFGKGWQEYQILNRYTWVLLSQLAFSEQELNNNQPSDFDGAMITLLLELGWLLIEKKEIDQSGQQAVLTMLANTTKAYIDLHESYINQSLSLAKDTEKILVLSSTIIARFSQLYDYATTHSLDLLESLADLQNTVFNFCVKKAITALISHNFDAAQQGISSFDRLLTLLQQNSRYIRCDVGTLSQKYHELASDLQVQQAAYTEKCEKQKEARRRKKHNQQLRKINETHQKSVGTVEPTGIDSQSCEAKPLSDKPEEAPAPSPATTLEVGLATLQILPTAAPPSLQIRSPQEKFLTDRSCWPFKSEPIFDAMDRLSALIQNHPCEAYLYGSAHYKAFPNDLDILLHSTDESFSRTFLASLLREPGVNFQTEYQKAKNSFTLHVVKVIWNKIPIEFILTPLTPTEHSQHLDYTIGGQYYDFRQQRLLCPQPSSHLDIKNKVLRTISNATALFKSDPGILFRTVKLIATEGFRLDPSVATAIKTVLNEPTLLHINSDKLFYEYTKLFLQGNARANLAALKHLNLFDKLFPLPNLTEPWVSCTHFLLEQVVACTDRFVASQQAVSPTLLYYAAYWFIFVRNCPGHDLKTAHDRWGFPSINFPAEYQTPELDAYNRYLLNQFELQYLQLLNRPCAPCQSLSAYPQNAQAYPIHNYPPCILRR